MRGQQRGLDHLLGNAHVASLDYCVGEAPPDPRSFALFQAPCACASGLKATNPGLAHAHDQLFAGLTLAYWERIHCWRLTSLMAAHRSPSRYLQALNRKLIIISEELRMWSGRTM